MNRLFVLGAVMLMGVVAVLGWMLGVSPKLSEARAAKAEQATVETQNASFEVQLATLKKQFESIGELRTELADLREAVPSGADIPAFVGQLDKIAQAQEVTLASITVSDAQPYVPVVAATPAAPAPAEGAATGDSAAAAPIDAAAAAAAAVPAPVVNELITATNFVAVPISLSVDGSYDNVLDFIEGLQKGTRLVMVTTVTTTKPEATSSVTSTISGFIYVLLDPNAATAATAATDATDATAAG